MNKHEIKQIVSNILCDKPLPIDPQIIAELYGYTVKFSYYNSNISDKIASYITDDNIIHINNAMKPKDIIFAIAHELGVGILGLDRKSVFQRSLCENPSFCSNSKDYLANIFAAYLLIPDYSLEKVSEWIYVDNALCGASNWKSYSDALCVNEKLLKYRTGEIK